MNTPSPLPAKLKGSGIIQDALVIEQCSGKAATHFVLSHGKKIKYIISLNGGVPWLKNTVVAYNKKLALLLSLLPILPWSLLSAAGLGYFAKVALHPEVQVHVPERSRWNILIGTYDSAQKIILQCFSPDSPSCIFIKVGNSGSAGQMEREIRFLRRSVTSPHIILPDLLNSALISEGNSFNILITKQFKGDQIPPALTPELFRITREIAALPLESNDADYEFTHGDFAPWNVRQKEDKFIVFDWEHCSPRPCGYDAAYFIIMVEVALRHRLFDEAFEIAAAQLHKLDPSIILNKQLIYNEFTKSTKALTF